MQNSIPLTSGRSSGVSGLRGPECVDGGGDDAVFEIEGGFAGVEGVLHAETDLPLLHMQRAFAFDGRTTFCSSHGSQHVGASFMWLRVM